MFSLRKNKVIFRYYKLNAYCNQAPWRMHAYGYSLWHFMRSIIYTLPFHKPSIILLLIIIDHNQKQHTSYS